MRGETIADYVWTLGELKSALQEAHAEMPNVIFVDRDLALLSALNNVFPSVPVLLCLWHVIEAVETHARATFQRIKHTDKSKKAGRDVLVDSPEPREFCGAFLALVRSTSETEYEERRAELYSLSNTEARYIDTTWLDKWKKKIVRCWTNDVVHFGLQTTSRVEGYHRSLKRWLDTSTVDLLSLYHRLQVWWNWTLKQHNDVVSDIEVRVRVDLNIPLFRRVQKKVHTHALTQCLRQLQLVSNNACSGVYTKTTGLPCVHKLRLLKQSGQSLVLLDFNSHWWVSQSGEESNSGQEPVQDPATSAQCRAERALARRHSTSHTRGVGPNGTRRAPSGFELSTGTNIPSLGTVLSSTPRTVRVLPPIRYNP